MMIVWNSVRVVAALSSLALTINASLNKNITIDDTYEGDNNTMLTYSPAGAWKLPESCLSAYSTLLYRYNSMVDEHHNLLLSM